LEVDELSISMDSFMDSLKEVGLQGLLASSLNYVPWGSKEWGAVSGDDSELVGGDK
jgi:hypothetical protein